MPELLEEELEVLPATKSPHGYLTSPLTDNIHMTDEGYLVVVGCPIARTGWMRYRVSDLPQERAKELGVDVSNPEASIELYRAEKDVFHPEFLASLNGKPICDSHPPNGEFVDPKNFKKYACGHIQNVRRGTERLEDGEWPIIADLIISDHQLIEKVKNKTAREISLGYDFSIDRDGEKICQVNMSGNHNAVVPDGRAGDFVSIADAEPAVILETQDAVTTAEVQPSLPIPAQAEGIVAAYKPIVLPPTTYTKEKQTVADKKPTKDWLRIFKGKHLIEMARATDADPEEVLDAAEAITNDEAEPPKDTKKDEFAEDKKKAKDGGLPEALKEHAFKAKDKAKDEEEDKMADARKKAHDALDRALDSRVKDKKRAKDADIEELKDLLDEYLDEEKEEPEHAEDADVTELEKTLKGEDEEGEDCPDCGKAMDECECEGASGEENFAEDADPEDRDESEEFVTGKEAAKLPSEGDLTPERNIVSKATDRARAADGAMATLSVLRPFVARSTDKGLRTAFNRALDSVKKSSRASSGSYGAFAGSARARDKAPRNPTPDRARAADGKADPISKLQASYDAAFKGGK